MVEDMIKMHKESFQMLVRGKDNTVIEITIPGYTFSFLGVDFGCTNKYYYDGKLETYDRQWILVDLETKLACGRAVSRRTFSSLLTPQYVNRIKEIKKKRKLYKSENRC